MKRLSGLCLCLLVVLVSVLLFLCFTAEAGEQHGDVDASATRGAIKNAPVVYGGVDREAMRLEWNHRDSTSQEMIQEVSIFPDSPYAIYVPAVTALVDVPGNWWDDGWRFRLPITVEANGYERYARPAEVALNFTHLLTTLGRSGTFDEDSIRLVEVDAQGAVVDESVDFQFDHDEGYDASTNARGTVVFLLDGTTAADAARYFHLYFDTTDKGPFVPLAISRQVTVTDNISHEGQISFRIETRNATYYYHKQGAGFASMEDQEGADWIGYHPTGGSAGHYRGIPNMGDEFAHPGYTNGISSLRGYGPIKATIFSETPDEKWALTWEMYPTYAKMTLLKRNANYWFLYEGTPNGQLDLGRDFVVRSTGVKTYVSEDWVGDIPAPEWVYFGDDNVSRVLFVAHHEDDDASDQFWQMEGNMTVFGFGRQYRCCGQYLTLVPAHFTIGFAGTASSAPQVIASAFRDLVVTAGQPEAVNHPPVLDPLGDQVVASGNVLSFTVSASDPDGVTPTLGAENLPGGADFTDNGNGTALFDWLTTPADEGSHVVTFIASDGVLTDSQAISITVETVNDPPVLDPLDDQVVVSGNVLSFTVSASDPDGITPTLGAENLPGGADFTDNGNGTALFDWLTTSADEGSHVVTFIASDGVLTDSQAITITVNTRYPYHVFLPSVVLSQQASRAAYQPPGRSLVLLQRQLTRYR